MIWAPGKIIKGKEKGTYLRNTEAVNQKAQD